MHDTLEALAAGGMELLGGMQSERVALSLPRVKMSVSLNLTETLKDLGLEALFSPEADFSGMVEEGSLYVSGVVQNVCLEVNEQGTRAAAATMVGLAGSALEEQPPIEMEVNRPYALLIYDEETNTILFAAVVSDPSALPEEAPAATPAP